MTARPALKRLALPLRGHLLRLLLQLWVPEAASASARAAAVKQATMAKMLSSFPLDTLPARRVGTRSRCLCFPAMQAALVQLRAVAHHQAQAEPGPPVLLLARLRLQEGGPSAA